MQITSQVRCVTHSAIMHVATISSPCNWKYNAHLAMHKSNCTRVIYIIRSSLLKALLVDRSAKRAQLFLAAFLAHLLTVEGTEVCCTSKIIFKNFHP